MRTLLILTATFLPFGIASALADETSIQLKPGGEVVENNCSACHSLDYPVMNSPFLDEKGWTAEVTKMVSVYGAEISEEDQKAIIAYLTENYGKPAQ